MTVSSTLNKQVFPGNGATTVFNFSFAFPGGSPTQEAANIQVFYTDAFGNVSLLAPTAYTLVLNPPTGTDPTPVGGSVTYSPVGGPIALGTFLTVFRNLTFDQATSLANQQTLYQQVIESALDYQVMLSQQLVEIQDRALVVPISDPVPNALPAVAARAGLILGFDSNGNPVAVNAAPTGVISAAMIPVVGASTLAQARTNMGLGTIATESIGLGLADNGSGSVQIQPNVIVNNASVAITINDHTATHLVNALLTYTLPATSTLFKGFYFTIDARGLATTLAPNASDAFDGMSTGASLVVPAGFCATFITNGAGTWYVTYQSGLAGNNSPINANIVPSTAGNALIIALKDRNGNDPSPASPVLFTTGTSGQIVHRAVVAPLSITIPAGATLGTVNGFNCRFWIALFDNAGTPALGIWQSVAGMGTVTQDIRSWLEWLPTSTIALSASSNSAQTWYTASSLTAASFKILGYIEMNNPTAGLWNAAFSVIQLFGPGLKKPGDVMQVISTPGAALTISNMHLPNIVDFICTTAITNNGTPANAFFSANSGTLFTYGFGTSAASAAGTIAFVGLHQSNATSDTFTASVAANNTLTGASIVLKEIQV